MKTRDKVRISPVTGRPYPKCKHCPKTIYTDGLCWGHYIKRRPLGHLAVLKRTPQ
jgi:hypothetical protein